MSSLLIISNRTDCFGPSWSWFQPTTQTNKQHTSAIKQERKETEASGIQTKQIKTIHSQHPFKHRADIFVWFREAINIIKVLTWSIVATKVASLKILQNWSYVQCYLYTIYSIRFIMRVKFHAMYASDLVHSTLFVPHNLCF